MTHVLIMPPDLPFADLRKSLTQHGWQECHMPALYPPLIAGEPEAATFERTDGTQLHYAFNPALYLRQIQSASPLPSLPSVKAEEIENWLQSADPETRLRGEMATRILSQQTTDAKDSSTERESRPNHAQILDTFDRLPPLMRRASVRWMLSEHTSSLEPLLPDLLMSDDPELAATALFAAARLNDKAWLPLAGKAKIEINGLSRNDKTRLKAVRKLVLEMLSDEQPLPNSQNSRRDDFLRAILGDISDLRAEDLMFIAALTEPPPVLAKPVMLTDSNNELPMMTVERQRHWLGSETGSRRAKPARSWTPPVKYKISALVFDHTLYGDDVNQFLAQKSEQFKAHLRLPTGDEWEAAMRGPSGLPRAWGMTQIPPVGFLHSTWGLQLSDAPEWVDTNDGLRLMGTDTNKHLAIQRVPENGDRALVRPVVKP